MKTKPDKLFTISMFIIVFLFLLTTFTNMRPPIVNLNENSFTSHYTNKKNETVKMRYRYELDFKKANSFAPETWNENDYLYKLIMDNNKVAMTTLEQENKTIIPEISNIFSIKAGELVYNSFDIQTNPLLENNVDLIRFEVKVILEEFVNKRWTPVYQVVFMKRGEYMSVDKGPIEILYEK